MSTSDFERIDSLMKLCGEHQKSLHESLENVTRRVKEVSELMSVRIHQMTQKISTLRSKFDSVHSNNQKLLEKIKEKLDEIDAQEMEANREFDEFRRKVNFAKRQRRKYGLIRHVGYKIYNHGVTILSFLGWYKPVKKNKETKTTELIPIVSPSENILTVVMPDNSNLTPPLKVEQSELTKKRE